MDVPTDLIMILNSGASSPDEIASQIGVLTHAKVYETVDDAACITGDRYTEAILCCVGVQFPWPWWFPWLLPGVLPALFALSL